MLQLSHIPGLFKDHSFIFLGHKEILLKPNIFVLLPVFDSPSSAVTEIALQWMNHNNLKPQRAATSFWWICSWICTRNAEFAFWARDDSQWPSHSSIPDQDLTENWSSSICQHVLRSFREQRGCIINKPAPCNHPEAMRELKMSAERQGVAEGLVLFVQIMNWLQRIEWSCCLSNPVRERKIFQEIGKQSLEHLLTQADPGALAIPGRNYVGI